MNQPTNTDTSTRADGLQSDPVCCNLQTACKLESSKNNTLHQFADCRDQIADTPCKLNTNPVVSRVSGGFPVCTQTLSPYGREEPRRGALHPGEEDGLASACMMVLCLDLGTKTGWAFRSPDALITSGTAEFRHDRYQGGGMRFLKFKHWLDKMLTTVTQIDAIYFEEVRRHLGVDAAHAYGGFLAHLSAWCEQHGIAYEGVPVGTIKRHVTGKGNACKAKVIQAVRQRGHHPDDDNEADALALLHWVIDTRIGGSA